ncbi:hypothetical protein [uncultured Psychrobacter sp.]|uniref:hypothetical protein n=1 Tax=uncultured Psychrobacter sp. TaxID=259303 RepID=UPI0025920121|nr:hypothetical protein [uncultured Psychrobacter sp.]
MKKSIFLLIALLTGCEQSTNNVQLSSEQKMAKQQGEVDVDLSKAKVVEPSEDKRQITAYLLDPESKNKGFIEKQINANKLTIQQVFDNLQSKGEQDIAVICKGGYNPQPPYYELTFDLFNGDKLAGDALGMDRNTPIHELCMMKAYDHFNLLKANNDPDLKYYVKQ